MLRLFKTAALGFAPVFGTGDQQLSMVYGPDLAEAIPQAYRSAVIREGPAAWRSSDRRHGATHR
jgi:hypothetical protein